MIDPVEFGKAMGEIVRNATAPLLKRIEELEARPQQVVEPVKTLTADDVAPMIEGLVKSAVAEAVSQIEVPEAEAVDVEGIADDAVAKLLASDRLETLADLKSTEAVAAHFQANPVKNGANAAPEQIAFAVKEYLTANPPEKGKDGVDVKDLFRADGRRLIAVMSDGTTKDLGQFVGEDGRDGLGFEDATLELDGGDAVLKLVRDGKVKELRIPLPTMQHIGFWQTGMAAKSTQTTTHDGSLWIAMRDTKEAPSYQSKDWQLAARKGRDGVDGKAPPKSGPVNLKGDGDA